jgi:hypothetical protein
MCGRRCVAVDVWKCGCVAVHVWVRDSGGSLCEQTVDVKLCGCVALEVWMCGCRCVAVDVWMCGCVARLILLTVYVAVDVWL